MTKSPHSSFGNEEYTVGWICALPIELTAARGMLDEQHGDPQTPPAMADKNTYVLGSMGKFKVVVACLPLDRMGSVSATAVANRMLFTFPNIRVCLLVGIGAGIPDYKNHQDIRLGDVVISSHPETGGVVVYDFGKKLADGSFHSISALNRPPESLTSALGKMKSEHDMHDNKIAEYIDQMLEKYPKMRKKGYFHPGPSFDRLFQPDCPHIGSSCADCDPSKEVCREERLEEMSVVHYGTIASGNMVVKNASLREEIRAKHGAICLEMEAAGLMNSFPCIVIRGISDYADVHKNDRWQPCAAAAAAACAKEFLEHLQPRAVDGTPAAKEILSRVHSEVMAISEFVTTKQTQEALDWITPLHFERQQNDSINQRQEGTGLWLLQSDEFTQWLKQPQQTLFCPGIPGSGKTVMTSIVVEHLRTKFQDNPEVQIGHIFCSYQPTYQQTNLDVLLSLLRQLAVTNCALLPTVEEFHKRHSKSSTRPNADEVRVQLSKTALSYKKVFVVIDALDEYCSFDPEELKTLLSEIFSLQKEAPINFFATSRFISEITECFSCCIVKEIRAQEEDILRYVNKRILLLVRSTISQYPDTQESVRCRLVKCADGMFLLARLHMNHLMGYPSIGELEEALSDLPYGKAALEIAYDQAIQRIKAQQESCVQMAIRTLSWLTYSKRALAPEELQHALGTRPGMRKLNRKFLPALQTIDSLCAGLVVFNRNTGIIRLVHYTTQEFFMGNETLNNAELEITMTSIRYLSFEDFSSGRCTSYEEFMNRKQLYPLHEYCSINWASHASAAAAFFDSEELLDIITRFLEQEENLHASTQALLFGKPALSMSTLRYVPRRLTKVHVAAYHGLNDLLVVYQHLKEDMDPRDSEGNTPLMYAAQNGNLETTRLLLESRKINPDSKDQYGMSALLGGVASQNTAIIELLLSNGVSPNPEGEGNWSALCEASQMGNIEIMQLLIDHGAQIDYCCDDVEGFGTPLMLSWDSKNRNATLFLLDKGASPEIKNSFGETPLIEATRVGERDLVRLLLSRGVEVDPKGISDATPFLIAAKWGYLEILQDLLHAGADIEMTQYEKKTALLIACENGFDEMVAYLLDQGVDANVQDHSLENGLFHASRRGNVDMANRLLQAGVDPNHQNKDGATALFLAAERGHESLARCLLQHQIDLTIQNNALKTAIFVAVENAHFSFARQLIELGADFHCEDITGNTCLFYSCWSGNTDLAALLLDHGADPHHRNVLGETPLFFAARGGHCEIVKLLLDHNSEIDPRNLLGETPLLFAAQRLWAKWHDEPQAYDRVMALLLYRGAHPDPYPDPSVHPNLAELLKCASDTSSNPRPRLNQFQAARQIWGSRVQSYSGTQLSTFLNHLKGPGGGNFYVFRERWIARNASPLLVAVGGGHVDLVRMLLKREFNRDLPANQGKTLLAEAIEHKHLETTKLLLDEGPDPFASKQSFHHLIGCAARTGNTAILELLFELNSSFGPLDSSALSTATWNGHIEAARFFLNNGVDPYCPDHNSQTPFYYAVRDGKPEIVKLFLQHTKNAHEKDKHGRTLLFYAVQGRCVPVVQLLLQAGADPNTTEDGGQSPLLYDIRNTVRGIVPQTIHEQRLLELKSRNNTGSIGGNSPLFFAAGYGDESIVKQLLDYGADPDPADIFEERPILWAAGRGFEPVVKILLEKGANASHVDGSNMSPLLWAFGRQCEGLPEKITRGGENWNSQGQPDREAVVRLLLRYGADCNIADQNGQQPLMMAVELGSKSLVATLLRSGSDPNQRNKYGRTSLMTATVRGMGSIAAILLRAPGIDRDATDIFGRTSVTEAKERGEAQILSLLMEDSLDDQLINPSMILDRVESPHYDYEVCDVCGAHEIDEDRDAYHFLQCIGHRFCICNWCKQYGATCLADVHRVLES